MHVPREGRPETKRVRRQERGPRTGRRVTVRARYRVDLHVIAEQYTEYELIGPPDVREVNPGWFSPARQDDKPA